MAVAGNHVYVMSWGSRSSTLHLIDVSNPTSPQIIGAVDTPDIARAVAVAGKYAYVAAGSSGLQVIDISNPTSPRIVGAMATPDIAHAVAVAGNDAYVADGAAGLQILHQQCQ